MKKNKPKKAGQKIFLKSFSKLSDGSGSSSVVRKLQAANLPVPGPAPGSKAFIELQKQWYAKLAAEGFKDLEWVDHRTGAGHDGPHLRGSLQGGALFHPGRALYYQLASNYLIHCKNLKGYNRFIWALHSEGITYNKIVDEVKQKYGEGPSKYKIFYQIKALAKKCKAWNKRYSNGLLHKRADDRRLIVETYLADFIATEYDWIEGEIPID